MITGGNGVGRCRDDDDNDDDFAAGWICTTTTYPVLLLVLPPSSSARRPVLPSPHPPCSSPGHLASHMHSSPSRPSAPNSALHCQAESHSARGFATARWLLPGTVNGQQEIKLVNRYLWVRTDPRTCFFFFTCLNNWPENSSVFYRSHYIASKKFTGHFQKQNKMPGILFFEKPGHPFFSSSFLVIP